MPRPSTLLGVLALGAAVLIVCGYFAEKAGGGASRPAMTPVPRPANLHSLVKDPSDSTSAAKTADSKPLIPSRSRSTTSTARA